MFPLGVENGFTEFLFFIYLCKYKPKVFNKQNKVISNKI